LVKTFEIGTYGNTKFNNFTIVQKTLNQTLRNAEAEAYYE